MFCIFEHLPGSEGTEESGGSNPPQTVSWNFKVYKTLEMFGIIGL
jgi:hypothetical protein